MGLKIFRINATHPLVNLAWRGCCNRSSQTTQRVGYFITHHHNVLLLPLSNDSHSFQSQGCSYRLGGVVYVHNVLLEPCFSLQIMLEHTALPPAASLPPLPPQPLPATAVLAIAFNIAASARRLLFISSQLQGCHAACCGNFRIDHGAASDVHLICSTRRPARCDCETSALEENRRGKSWQREDATTDLNGIKLHRGCKDALSTHS